MVVRWYYAVIFVRTRTGLRLQAPVLSKTVSADGVLRYAVKQLFSIICLVVAVLLHQIPYLMTGANMSDNFVHDVQTVGVVVGVFQVSLRVRFFLCLDLFFSLFFHVLSVTIAS